MNNNLTFQANAKNKIKDANALLTKKSFPLSIFHTYNPSRAAELYTEAADIYHGLDNHILAAKYYELSANTYLITASYGLAAHSYAKAAEICSSKSCNNTENAITLFKLASKYHTMSGSNSLAASRLLCAANLLNDSENNDKACDVMGEVLELYEKAGMTANRAILLDTYLSLLIKIDKFYEAGGIMLELGTARERMNANFYILLAVMCYFLCDNIEAENVYELMSAGEEKEIVKTFLVNDEESLKEGDFEEKIRKYERIVPVKNYMSKIIDIVIKKLKTGFGEFQPEIDIL